MILNFNELNEIELTHRDIRRLAIYLQELESMLYDGYPHIYADLRIIAEESVNVILKYSFCITTEECNCKAKNKDNCRTCTLAKNHDECWSWIKFIENDPNNNKTFFCKYKPGAFPFKLKLILLNKCFKKRSIDNNWGFLESIDDMNEKNHEILLPLTQHDECLKSFENRFEWLRIFHDCFYNTILLSYFNKNAKEYCMPTKDEYNRIVKKYIDRINNYKRD